MLALPNQIPGLIERYGLTRADVDREAWVIDQAGNRYSAALAANRVLQELGNGWGIFNRLYTFPPFRWAEDHLYRWVADHRPLLSKWLGTTPACEQSGNPCQ